VKLKKLTLLNKLEGLKKKLAMTTLIMIKTKFKLIILKIIETTTLKMS